MDARERELLVEAEAALTKCWKGLLAVKPVLRVSAESWAGLERTARRAHDVSIRLRRELRGTVDAAS
jgi:hypothetical protein